MAGFQELEQSMNLFRHPSISQTAVEQDDGIICDGKLLDKQFKFVRAGKNFSDWGGVLIGGQVRCRSCSNVPTRHCKHTALYIKSLEDQNDRNPDLDAPTLGMGEVLIAENKAKENITLFLDSERYGRRLTCTSNHRIPQRACADQHVLKLLDGEPHTWFFAGPKSTCFDKNDWCYKIILVLSSPYRGSVHSYSISCHIWDVHMFQTWLMSKSWCGT